MEAGNKLKEMLTLGASRPWKEAMEVMTGEPKMDTAAFREYFMPLEKWLKEENKKNGVTVGWKVDDFDKFCEAKAGASSSGSSTNIFLVSTFLAAIKVPLR